MTALAAPTVLGAIHESEARTLALETRGFSRPARPTLLWPTHDTSAQRVVRWAVLAVLALLVVARVTGVALPC